MARTKQTARKPTLPKTVKFVFYVGSKKTGEMVWVPPDEDAFSRLALEEMARWDDRPVGFPLDVLSGTYEYGQPVRRRKRGGRLFDWRPLTADHRIVHLMASWRDATIYVRSRDTQ